jgi:hypothetical protein
MKAKLYFDIEDGKAFFVETSVPGVSFEEWIGKLARSAPNGLLHFEYGAFPYSRLRRIEKLED